MTKSESVGNLRKLMSAFSVASIEKASGVSRRSLRRYMTGERTPNADAIKGIDKAWRSLFGVSKQDSAAPAKPTVATLERVIVNHEKKLNQEIAHLKQQRTLLIDTLAKYGFDVPKPVLDAINMEEHYGFLATPVAHSGDQSRKIYDIRIPAYPIFRFRLENGGLSLTTAVSTESQQVWSEGLGPCHDLSDVLAAVERHKAAIEDAACRFVSQMRSVKTMRVAVVLLHDLSGLGTPEPGTPLYRAISAIKHAIMSIPK